MGIEITSRVPLAEVNRQTNKLNGNNTQPSHNKATEAPSDSVSLSVGDLLSKLDSAPADNSARIKELKNAIENGSYAVDSHQLAGSIIQNETELGSI